VEGGGIREVCSGAVGLLCTVWLSRFSLRMELIECSETSAYCGFNQTPGKYPKEYIHVVYIRLYLLMMGLDTPENCIG